MGPVMYVILVLVLWFYNLWIKIDNNNNNITSGRPSFDMITSYVKKGRDSILIGGSGMFLHY